MFGFSAKLPINEEERQWIDDGFLRLDRMLGAQRMLEAQVVLPIAEHFPDPYDKTLTSVEVLFQRICGYMQVDSSAIQLEVLTDETRELKKLLPYWHGGSRGCAGLYTHEATDTKGGAAKGMVVALSEAHFEDPLVVVATLAHELGHVILLGGGLIRTDVSDHEPLTDLLTVYLGFGIFTANSAARFRQYQDETRAGWSMQRLGYLPQEAFGYALAKFAARREEAKPKWVKHLTPNIRYYYKSSRAWLAKNVTSGNAP
jgi:hypothetical protein